MPDGSQLSYDSHPAVLRVFISAWFQEFRHKMDQIKSLIQNTWTQTCFIFWNIWIYLIRPPRDGIKYKDETHAGIITHSLQPSPKVISGNILKILLVYFYFIVSCHMSRYEMFTAVSFWPSNSFGFLCIQVLDIFFIRNAHPENVPQVSQTHYCTAYPVQHLLTLLGSSLHLLWY